MASWSNRPVHHILCVVSMSLGAVLPTAAPAWAAGCGGYVNVFVSGCAPWDNNPRRLPGPPVQQAPRPGAATMPQINRQSVVTRPQPMPVVNRPPVLQTGNRLITDNGAGLRPGGNILSDQGGGFRR